MGTVIADRGRAATCPEALREAVSRIESYAAEQGLVDAAREELRRVERERIAAEAKLTEAEKALSWLVAHDTYDGCRAPAHKQAMDQARQILSLLHGTRP